MKKDSVSVFLPVRKGSERISNKNTKRFAQFSGGLLELKLWQLLDSFGVDEVIVSTNDEACIAVAEKFVRKSPKIKINVRPDYLSKSDTNLTDLVLYAPKVCNNSHILWTHVTSPFLDAEFYSKVVNIYQETLEKGYDSLMTARNVQSFLWDIEQNEVINKTSGLKWPRTQDLKTYYEIDSGVFLASKEIYSQLEDRVGSKPFILETNTLESFDVDWPDDFVLAQKLYNALH